MKLFWPMAIIKRGNEWDIQHTYDGALTYRKAVDQIKLWENAFNMDIILWRIDVSDNGETIKGTPCIFYNKVKELWLDFGDIPMNPETECIEDFWGKFNPGTHREEIWKWFEETFHIRTVDLMYDLLIN